MKNLKIEGELYPVDEKVFEYFEFYSNREEQYLKQIEIVKKALRKANDMLSDAQYLLDRVYKGYDIKKEDKPIWGIGNSLRIDTEAQFKAEASDGLMGWLMRNWPALSTIKCTCKLKLISFEVVRATGQLKCDNCNHSPNTGN